MGPPHSGRAPSLFRPSRPRLEPASAHSQRTPPRQETPVSESPVRPDPDRARAPSSDPPPTELLGTNPPSVGTAHDPASTPARWGEFALLERLGTGTFGEVWRAWDPALRREVAVKFLRDQSATEGAGQAALLEEARALARIRHPGVASVYGVAEFDGRAGLWMEYLRGTSLAAAIEARGAMPWREVARIGRDLSSALEALEQAGLVHRDIKPANVVMEADGRVVLADFGLGVRRRLLETTAPTLGWGTPLFMAPSLLGGGAPTFRTDLYALGVTLVWALTGRAPFQSRRFDELKIESAQGPRFDLPASHDAPAALLDLIERSLQESASARFTAAKMRAGLEALLSDSGRESDAMAERPSIAVLPFLNRSGDESTDYFSDGLADELVMVLSKIQGLRVIARTASFQFKGKNEGLAVIGAKLRVATLLEGSVVKSDRRLRVSVRLVKVPEGDYLWSEDYDRTWDDVFAVQDDIAQRVVTELKGRLLGTEGDPFRAKVEVAAAVRGRGEDPEVHRLLLQARYHMGRVTPDDIARAIECIEEALERDATYPLLWTLLGQARLNQVDFGWAPLAEGVARAREDIGHALELDPDLAEAHGVLGWLRMHYERNWSGAEASFRRALDLEPNAANLRRGGVLAMCLGRPHQAIEFYSRSMIHDPVSTSAHNNLGFAYLIAGRYDEAERELRQAIELAPKRVGARSQLALALMSQGRMEEALGEAWDEPQEIYRLWVLAILHYKRGDDEESRRPLRELTEKYSDDGAFQIAQVHAVRGEVDAAFEWLDRAYRQQDGGLASIKATLMMDPIKADPRWSAFLLRMGFDA